MCLKLKLIFLALIFSMALQAQKTAVFNGKTYMVYPQTIEMDDWRSIEYYEHTLGLSRLEFPPVIGTVADGEYLIYTTRFITVITGKGKNRREDTVYQVYGTFTIRNNKKEGNAYIYEIFRQHTVVAVIPYKNDLIDGEMKVINDYRYDNSYLYDDDYPDDYQYFYHKRDKALSYRDDRIYYLNYREGVLNGLVRYYRTWHKDTLLMESFQTLNGKKNGEYRSFSYYRHGKKIRVYSETHGTYTNAQKTGEWVINDRYDDYIGKEYYTGGKMTHEKSLDDSGRVFWSKSYGRDSVIKYVPDYASRKNAPYTAYGGEDTEDVIVFYGKGMRKYYYIIDNYASSNYYTDWYGGGVHKDTVIKGELFRLWTYMDNKKKKEVFYVIDSCHDKTGFYFCLHNLWTKKYDKKGRLIYFEKTERFQKYNFSDSLIPELQEDIKFRKGHKELFYQKTLDYNYSNVTFTKGKNKGCRLYFEVRGGSETGTVIQYIKIPSAYDTVSLVDTLMLNGEWLYKHDSYFQEAYTDFLDLSTPGETNKFEPVDYINEYIYRYFSLSPVAHRQILLGGKPFSGKLTLNVSYRKNSRKTRAKVYEIEQLFDFIQKKLAIEINIERDIKMLKVDKTVFIVSSAEQTFELDEGLFSGSIQSIDIFGQLSLNTYCYNNRVDSDIRFYTWRRDYGPINYKRRRYRQTDKRIKKDNIHPIPASSIQYKNGKKNGQWFLMYRGDPDQSLTFHDDRKHGMQINYNYFSEEGYSYIGYVCHMVNDTVNGDAWITDMDGLPAYHGTYDMGLPHGTFTNYFQDDTSKYFKEQFTFDKGFLTGNYLQYRDSDNLALSIRFDRSDSMFFSAIRVPAYTSRFYIPNLGDWITIAHEGSLTTGSDGQELISLIFTALPIKKGYYSYYYKSGTLFSKGIKQSEIPKGIWKFYREGKERLYKQIDFRDSILSINGTDTLFSYGLVKTYYDDGRLMFTGFALDKTSTYSCESEADMPIEDDYYLEFYDTVGKPILVNGAGFIKELQANGYILKEGKIENYQKQGVWVYYTKFGLPEAIGAYKDGKKNGRWLKGDLGGLNLNDKICYMDDTEFRAWINAYGGNLSLTEEFYVDGVLVSSNFVNTIKRQD